MMLGQIVCRLFCLQFLLSWINEHSQELFLIVIVLFVSFLIYHFLTIHKIKAYKKTDNNQRFSKEDSDDKEPDINMLNELIRLEKEVKSLKKKNQLQQDLSFIAQKSENAILLMDADGNFIWVNEGYTKLFGYTLEELKKEISVNIIGPKTDPKIKDQIEYCKTRKKSINYEFSTISRDGKNIWINATLTPILDDNGNVRNLLAIDSDVTNIKDAENEIIRQKQLIQEQRDNYKAEKLKSELAYSKLLKISNYIDELRRKTKISALNDIVKEYTNLLQITSFGIGIFRKRTNTLEFKNFSIDPDTIKSCKENLFNEKSLSAYAFHNNCELVLNNIEHEYHNYLKEVEFPFNISPASAFISPLTVNNEKFGVFVAYSDNPDIFKGNQLNIIRIISSCLSLSAGHDLATHDNQSLRVKHKEYNYFGMANQMALKPKHEDMAKIFDFFVLYRPKELLSGDFYWFYRFPSDDMLGRVLIGLFDSTGNAIGGAFMSSLGNRLLNEIMNEYHFEGPEKILHLFDEKIRESLHQEERSNDEHLKGVLCYLEQKKDGTVRLVFAGARNHLYLYNHAEKNISQISGDSRLIGGIKSKSKKRFKATDIILSRGDIFYLATKGIIRQTDPNRRKFGTKKLIFTLEGNAGANLKTQKINLEAEFDFFRKEDIQRHDITIIGIKP